MIGNTTGRFHVGQRVRFSRAAYDSTHIPKASAWRAVPTTTEGVVRGLPEDRPDFIDVQRDGDDRAVGYHADFWEPVPGWETGEWSPPPTPAAPAPENAQ